MFSFEKFNNVFFIVFYKWITLIEEEEREKQYYLLNTVFEFYAFGTVLRYGLYEAILK